LHAALGLNAVLWIDRLLGLRSPGQFSAIEDRSTEDPPFITRALVDSQGQRWQEIDLQQLVSEPGFLSIAA
ncbi:MAG: chemotaxis protein CheW, partial [Hydrogenophaga sp.]|nr:chemotaxis protein CheW [Hydrogenophaga sp.]